MSTKNWARIENKDLESFLKDRIPVTEIQRNGAAISSITIDNRIRITGGTYEGLQFYTIEPVRSWSIRGTTKDGLPITVPCTSEAEADRLLPTLRTDGWTVEKHVTETPA